MMSAAVVFQTSPYLAALPFAAVIAVIIAAVAAFFVARSYSMKHKPVDYPLDQFTKLDLRERSDRFVGSQVTSRVISEDRGSGSKR